METAKKIETLLMVLALCLAAGAQPTPPEGQQAGQPPVAGSTAQDEREEETEPDTRPATGYLPLTLGSPATARSFVSTSFRVMQAVDSNGGSVSGDTEARATTNLSGNFKLQRVRARSEFGLEYTGGGALYPGHSEFNSHFHQVGLSQNFQGRRWSLSFADSFTYTPESLFGFGGLSGFGGFDVSPGLLPNQSVLSPRSPRLGNTVLAQIGYRLGKRTSLSASGSYGILRFTEEDSTFQDSDQYSGGVGFSYDVTAKDSLGVSYGFSGLRYDQDVTGNSADSDSHSVHAVYARRITGRLALRLAGGPQYNRFRVPLGIRTRTSWSADTMLSYRLRESELSLSYAHSVGSGGGVLGSSDSDQVQGSWTMALSRTWKGALRGGYSHNSSITELVGVSTSSFDTVFGGGTLSRPLGRRVRLVINYTFQHQTSNALLCPLGVCGELNRHLAGVGFEFTPQPWLIGR